MGIKVSFGDIDEFLEELRGDCLEGSVHRKIVRATSIWIPVEPAQIRYIVRLNATYRRDDELIELDVTCGEHWNPKAPGNEATIQKYEGYIEKMSNFCHEHCLSFRAGVYKEEGGDKQ